MDGETPSEFADHEEEEAQIEEEENENQNEVEPQGRQARRGGRGNNIRYISKNGLRGFSSTHRKMKVMITQAAKNIPIVLLSCSG